MTPEPKYEESLEEYEESLELDELLELGEPINADTCVAAARFATREQDAAFCKKMEKCGYRKSDPIRG